MGQSIGQSTNQMDFESFGEVEQQILEEPLNL